MIPVVGHVVRMAGRNCAPDDMGGGWVVGQAASRTWPSDTTRGQPKRSAMLHRKKEEKARL
jgi:hypothetical protein